MTRAMLKVMLAVLLALLFASQGAWASCTTVPANYQAQVTTVAVPNGKVVVPKGSAVGTTVWTSPTITLPAVSVSCTGQGYGVVATSLAPTGVANIYQTGIPYLGIRIVEVTNFTTVTNSVTRWITPAFNFNGPLSPSYQVSLVVIATVPNTNYSSGINGSIAQDFISDSAGALVNAHELHRLQIASFNTQVTGGAPCTTSDMTVSLGNHRASEFSGVGSTTAPTDFTILLKNCPSGMRSINYQIDPATTVVQGTGNSVVTLNAGSTATGVGVQLLDATGAPLALASQQTMSDSGGTYSISLKARYYKTAATVGPGSANSAMTFTITYN